MTESHPAVLLAANEQHTALFRATAVEASAGTQIGEPLVTHWRGVALFTLSAFALIVALLVFAATTEEGPLIRHG